MATVAGYVEKIKFRNEENGYSILSVSQGGAESILVGTFHFISEGEWIEASGNMNDHPLYGEQLQVEQYEIKAPEDSGSMERYLGSGAIKGVGAAMAARIVRRFKADTFRVIEEEPERLAEIKGISEKMARAIAEQMEEKREMRQGMMFLQGYGISLNLAVKIYRQYGPALYSIVKENPYRLADDIVGVGFKMADEIAHRAGVVADSDFRIKSGLLYTLLQAVANGHTYLPEKELLGQSAELLHVAPELIGEHIADMQMERKLVVRRQGVGTGATGPPGPVSLRVGTQAVEAGRDAEPERLVYASQYYYMELNTAKMLHDLNIRGSEPEAEIQKKLTRIQQQEQIELDEMQARAVAEAANSGLLIVTGGPGTGKTTTINAMIHYFESEGMSILLAAPTGRAAKRMTEATGHEAKTIHRMLEINGGVGEESSAMHFERNEEHPLDADAIIIDEMSMVDIYLMQSLLRAVNVGSRLILVGDINQLPSVGPGNVLKDMIHSGVFNVVQLTRIFRQAAESDIVVNAHKINDGEEILLGKPSKDFLFIKREQPDAIINAMVTLLKEKLPGYVHADPYDIQIMTPMRKGVLGAERLNTILQGVLNPSAEGKPEKEIGGVVYRVGDKVMQIKNNYQMEWAIRSQYGHAMESGTGIFNGDIGTIREINHFAEQLTVEFDERRQVEYSFRQLEELELAYAITIHKSQGSEYPAVVIPVYPGPRMLMTRNLIYTAVTRARSCVCLVGLPGIFQEMAGNAIQQRRYSGLKDRICELSELR